MSLKQSALIVAAAALIAAAAYVHFAASDEAGGAGAPMVAVSVPDFLPARAQVGRQSYEASCAACHGRNAAGQEGVAPPLVHVIYEPGHHGDESFQRAVARGVRAHHWRFGDMPPVAGLSRDDVAGIVAYVRELQRANGIR